MKQSTENERYCSGEALPRLCDPSGFAHEPEKIQKPESQPNENQFFDIVYSKPDTSHYPIFEGWKRYEIANHLGNVLAVITDRKRGGAASGTAIQWYDADVVSAQQYYPFGMLMSGHATDASLRRQYTLGSNDYRYGFNGKEGDDEVKGDDNQQDYGMRIYDPRVGRFLSVDPIAREYPWYTPYQFAGNKPIWAVDLDGLEEYYAADGAYLGKSGKSIKIRMTIRILYPNFNQPI